jgi:hypothetical protein
MKKIVLNSQKLFTVFAAVSFMIVGLSQTSFAQRRNKKDEKTVAAAPAAKPEAKPKPKKGEPKPYSEVITKDAISDEGLFTVHKRSIEP